MTKEVVRDSAKAIGAMSCNHEAGSLVHRYHGRYGLILIVILPFILHSGVNHQLRGFLLLP